MRSLIIHGGAWDIPDNLVEAHRSGVARALLTGWEILRNDGSAVDAVEATIRVLEDDGTFDAGRGSHLNADGRVELDASIMNGKSIRCGAVAAVHRIPHPISVARKIMDDSEHILLVGEGAERFAEDRGEQLCDPEHLACERERLKWKSIQGIENYTTKDGFRKMQIPTGTVGAVAMDHAGDISAGTSTGGTFNKYPGRVGDSPLIGCGTYADNELGGVSTTGWGEAMIKVVMAKTVLDIMEYNGGDVWRSAQEGIDLLKRKADGYGGIIALNTRGEPGVAFNTPRMARAYINEGMSEARIDV
jgi:beta-aspartyl-peptidase (threonine type)